MIKFAREDLKELKGYAPSRVTYKVKLDANESPVDVSDGLKKLILERIAQIQFNRYPVRQVFELRRKIADYLGVDPERLLLGNGSDEIIHMIMLSFAMNRRVFVPSPSFTMYKISALVVGAQVEEIPLLDDFQPDVREIVKKAGDLDKGLVVLCSPNNPTGNTVDIRAIETLLSETCLPLVVDEAYYDFSGKTCLPLLEKYDRLMILRTFSKAFCMAGIRLGYVISSAEICSELDKVRQPYNLNALSVAAATAAVENHEYKDMLVSGIISERARMYEQMRQMPGLRVYLSDANFLFFKPERPAMEVWKDLLDQGILTRSFPNEPLAKDYLRVSIGTKKENNMFLAALSQVCRS